MYLDPVGLPTIGYGHLIKPGEEHLKHVTLTRQQGRDLLAADLRTAERGVLQVVSTPLTQEQFDALVSFTFNVGVGNFQGSTMRRKLAARDYTGAAREFPRWVHAQGQRLPGLVRRRREEMELFLSGYIKRVPIKPVALLVGVVALAPLMQRLLRGL